MTELRLIFNGPADGAPAIEIQPNHCNVDIGGWFDRSDGKAELLIRFSGTSSVESTAHGEFERGAREVLSEALDYYSPIVPRRFTN